jgi:hypothetical protein
MYGEGFRLSGTLAITSFSSTFPPAEKVDI